MRHRMAGSPVSSRLGQHVNYLLLIVIGIAVGGLGTLIGAGGGFLLVPILLLMYPSESAGQLAAVSLAVVFLNALSGTVAYVRMKRIDYRAGRIFALATQPGAVIGALMTALIPRHVFDPLFGVLVMGVAAHYEATGHTIEEVKAVGEETAPDLRLGAVLIVGVGFVSSILGIGGGIIHVPLLIRILKFPVHTATATSHFVLAVMAGAGTVAHLVHGDLNGAFDQTAALGVGVIIGAQLGAAASKRAHGAWILRGLSLALIVVGIRLLLRL